MAIVSVGSRGTAQAEIPGTSLSNEPSATVAVGRCLVAHAAFRDDPGTVSIADGSGNTWVALGNYTHDPAGNARIYAWLCNVTTAITTADSVTVSHTNSIDDRSFALWEYSVDAGKFLQESATPLTSQVSAAAGFGSSAFAGLSSKERLYLRVGVKRANTGVAIVATVDFATHGLTLRAGSPADAIAQRAEHRINASTGETSNPTLNDNGNTASLFIALEEVAPIDVKVSWVAFNTDLPAEVTAGANSTQQATSTAGTSSHTHPTAGASSTAQATAAAGTSSSSQPTAGASSTTHATATAGTSSTSHLTAGANSTTQATATAGASSQTHLTAGVASTAQATATAGTSSVVVTHLTAGANSTAQATATAGTSSQTHLTAGAASTAQPTATAGTSSTSHLTAGANSSAQPTATAGASSTSHTTTGAASTAQPTATAGTSALANQHVTFGANSTAQPTATAGASSSAHSTVGAPSVMASRASAGASSSAHSTTGAASTSQPTATAGTSAQAEQQNTLGAPSVMQATATGGASSQSHVTQPSASEIRVTATAGTSQVPIQTVGAPSVMWVTTRQVIGQQWLPRATAANIRSGETIGAVRYDELSANPRPVILSADIR